MPRTVSPDKFARDYHKHSDAAKAAVASYEEKIEKIAEEARARTEALEGALNATVEMHERFAEINAEAYRTATNQPNLPESEIPNPPKQTRTRKPKDGAETETETAETE